MSLADLLEGARRRSIRQLFADVCAVAAVIGLAIIAFILLFGSANIGWQWLVLGVLLVLGIGGYRLRQKFPSLYQVAQRIDGRLGLADTLSTAEYFLPGGHVPFKEEADTDQSVCISQRARAEKLASGIDLKQAVPFRKPRAMYPAMVLFALAAGLFLWRYEALGSFDPRPPLVSPNISNFFQAPQQTAANKQDAESGDKPGEQADQQGERKDGDFAGDPEAQFDTPTPEQGQEQAKNNEEGQQQNQAGDNKDGSESKQAGDDAPQKEQASDDQKKDGDTSGQSDQEGGSVMDKLKQAVADLMNKMKPQNGKNEKGGPPDKQQNQDQQAGEGEQQEGGGEQADSQQSADGQQGQKSASNKTQEPQQGIGSQDGNKDVKDADAKKAMGKISELLAKRADNIKGAVMIEVGQTKQQLSTPVAQQASSQGAAGGEIHRDEVPAQYQQFVQKYFEQVRKNSAPATKSK